MTIKPSQIALSFLGTLMSAISSAQMYLDQSGQGQLLMYPVYTAANGNDTYMSLLNSTDDYKAVSVRFLQADDGQSVSGFYLYLSPRDHWSAVITKNPDGDGAIIRTGDTSCTIPSQLAATGSNSIGATLTFDEAENSQLPYNLIGHIEVIEMGTLNYERAGTNDLHPITQQIFNADNQKAIDQLKGSIRHVNNVPVNCSLLSAAWQAPTDSPQNTVPSSSAFYYPDTDNGPGDFTQVRLPLAAPSGGLSGHGIIINVPDGTAVQYEAVAVNNFMSGSYHPTPGGNEPGIDDGVPSAVLSTTDGKKAIFLPGPLVDTESEDIQNSGVIPGDKVSLFHVTRVRDATGSRLAGGGQIIAAIKDNNSRDSFHFYGDHSSNNSFLEVIGGEQGLGLPGSKEALSALLGHNSIVNDYVLDPSLNANTNWVLTFPTIRDFIVSRPQGSTTEHMVQLPFTHPYTRQDFPCAQFVFEYWNRDTDRDVVEKYESGFDLVTPPPPPTLCSASNVVSFSGKTNILSSDKSGENINYSINIKHRFQEGWAKLKFSYLDERPMVGRPGVKGQQTAGISAVTVQGLPVIGIAIQKYVNNYVIKSGAIANYSIALKHSFTTNISTD